MNIGISGLKNLLPFAFSQKPAHFRNFFVASLRQSYMTPNLVNPVNPVKKIFDCQQNSCQKKISSAFL